MANPAVKRAEDSEPQTEHARFVGALFERERATLLKYLTGLLRQRADAEDTLQETYMRLLQTETLDRGSFSRARSYAYKIATNLAYDRFRRRRATGPRAPFESVEPACATDPALQILSFEQSLAALKQVLSALEPRCRRVFLLRVAEGLGYEEIAAKLGVSKRTVEREMKLAVDTCKRRLEESER